MLSFFYIALLASAAPRAPGPCSDPLRWRTECPMTSSSSPFATFADLRNSSGVNSLSWGVLQNRSLPEHKTAPSPAPYNDESAPPPVPDECRRECGYLPPSEIRSYSGFIAANESLRAVIESDWELVHSLGTTHVELAGHLAAILSDPVCHFNETTAATAAATAATRRRRRVCTVVYNASSLPHNSIAQPRGPQTIEVTERETNGCQCSVFFNDANQTKPRNTRAGLRGRSFVHGATSADGGAAAGNSNTSTTTTTTSVGSTNNGLYSPSPRTSPTTESWNEWNQWNDGWSCTYGVANARNGKAVASIGANCGLPINGTLQWIRALGFYEGHTPFRVDPLTLVDMVSGAIHG